MSYHANEKKNNGENRQTQTFVLKKICIPKCFIAIIHSSSKNITLWKIPDKNLTYDQEFDTFTPMCNALFFR